jgi:hypothetical protein
VGSFKLPESMAPARSYSTCSARLCRVAQA